MTKVRVKYWLKGCNSMHEKEKSLPYKFIQMFGRWIVWVKLDDDVILVRSGGNPIKERLS
jgi:hypothetical protein